MRPGARVLHARHAFGELKELRPEGKALVTFDIAGEQEIPLSELEPAFPFDGQVFDIESMSLEELRKALITVRQIRTTAETPLKEKKGSKGTPSIKESLTEMSKDARAMEILRNSGLLDQIEGKGNK